MATSRSAAAHLFAPDATRHVVGIGELIVSADAADTIVTFALGSCLGIVVHDASAGVAGLLHAMLPQSSLDPVKAVARPAVYIDTGVPALFRACYRLGARKENMRLSVAGGASARHNTGSDHFEIGKRNYVALRQILWKNGVMIEAEDVGGSVSRTVSVSVATGVVLVRTSGSNMQLR
jgi:chemotaxis protein CheD